MSEIEEILRELVADEEAGQGDDVCRYCGAESDFVDFAENKRAWVWKHKQTCPIARARELLGITIKPEVEQRPSPAIAIVADVDRFVMAYLPPLDERPPIFDSLTRK